MELFTGVVISLRSSGGRKRAAAAFVSMGKFLAILKFRDSAKRESVCDKMKTRPNRGGNDVVQSKLRIVEMILRLFELQPLGLPYEHDAPTSREAKDRF
jgi:hypothetical protein